MSDRQILEKEEKIVLFSGKGSSRIEREFTIEKCINEGSSAVGYEAFHEDSGKGVLKEFYPMDKYGCLERDADSQLVASAEIKNVLDQFQKEKLTYIEPYEMLKELYKGSEDTDLQKFIPPFEICYGCNGIKDNTGTVYIWTPEPKVEATFDKICDEIHNHPDIDSEHKLTEVLCAINTLTKCICVLHQKSLLHRDINPSNFGFVKFGDETWTQNIALFDINTICFVNKEKDSVGTEGFLEPEWGIERPRNQTDIYSIGATLFTAIVVTDETRNPSDENKRPFLYYDEYYEKLPEMVKESELIKAAKQNLSAKVTGYLTKILQKCLCQRSGRYKKCEELLRDLDEVLFYIFPAEISSKHQFGEKWVLMEAEKSFDANKEKNSFLAMQYHLFEHPLYQCVSKDTEAKEKLNILLIGFGNYGQKFLDVCLQTGQIRNKYLNVTVVSDDETDKILYLEDRPELGEFFCIDNIDSPIDFNNYGDILFKTIELAKENPNDNKHIIEDIIVNEISLDVKHSYYIFIALGNDALNLSTASVCQEAAVILNGKVCINYACETTQVPNSSVLENDIYPVYVNADAKQSELHTDIERMAFNTHLVWEKDLNIDYAKVKGEFQNPYNHDSCVSSVLSAKYKLHSIGIDFNLGKDDLKRAAEAFNEKFSKQKNEDIWNELIWVEHRRWVTEKLCLGWTKMEISQCIEERKTKNNETKQHVCMLRSRPDQKLAKMFAEPEEWDKATGERLNELDELDRMSVDLHRAYVEEAEETKKENLLLGGNITEISRLIGTNAKANIAFQEWYACLKDIWNDDRDKVSLYNGLKAAFLNSLSNKKLREKVIKQIEGFEFDFSPVLDSKRYRNWKQDDVALVDNIPFILTFTENICMVIPYAVGDNTTLFGNVASPTVVNPKKIIYTYYLKGNNDKNVLMDPKSKSSIPWALQFLQKKQVRSEVEIVLIYNNNIKGIASEVLKDLKAPQKKFPFLQKRGNDSNKNLNGKMTVKAISAGNEDELLKKLELYLMDEKKKEEEKDKDALLIVEENKTQLSMLLQKRNSYKKTFSRYVFDSKNRSFHSSANCEELSFITKQPYMLVAEMLAMTMPSSKSQNQPTFFKDYKKLWEKYHENGNSSAWKTLCAQLKLYAEKNDTIALFEKKDPSEKGIEQEYHYLLPFSCEKGIVSILSALTNRKLSIIEKKSHIEPYAYTSDSCEVVIFDCYNNKELYDKVFSRVYALADPAALQVDFMRKNKEGTLVKMEKVSEETIAVKVGFDNLEISEASLYGNHKKDMVELVKFFEEIGYIHNFQYDKRKDEEGNCTEFFVSFTFGSKRIKTLLTKEGELLEIYIYHKIKECGYFDDVASGYEEINEKKNRTEQEMDCILTKGFRSCLIECKATTELEDKYYQKLEKNKEKIGINAAAVLIADTGKEAEPEILATSQDEWIPEDHDVITIWKKEEIDNIGNTMIQIFNGTYI